MKVEKENLQKQGNDFQNMEREVNQLQTRLAQSEEIFRKMNEQHNHTILKRSELDMLIHQMQVEADRQKEEYERPVGEAGHMSDARLAQLAAYHEKYEAEILTQHQTSLLEKAEEHAADHQEVVSGYKAQKKAACEDQARVSESASQATELQKAPEWGQVQMDKLIITLNTPRVEQELEQSSMMFSTKMFNHKAGARNGKPDALCRKNIEDDRKKYKLGHDLEDIDDVLPIGNSFG
ncbi:hypothetical protein DPMN_126858 [Dreissena polymorpha]|uniref:Uncharacterized protein n=2 Tax=Dreissena polymorpha TaxID=45954 RepID=A0A9D4H0V1_DREPO|nr:hypothetical protein DPMN_126858 [Dreissena polymorpha]